MRRQRNAMFNTLQLNLPPLPVEPLNPERLTTVDEVRRERQWLGLFIQARTRVGMSQKAAAGDLGGISVQLLSAQETGAENKHLSFRRMWRLGPPFWQELIALICQFHGLTTPGLSAQDECDRKLGRAFREAVQQAQR